MRFRSEDWVVVALVIVGVPGGLFAAYMKLQPILVAVLVAFGIAAAIFRFLGGVEGASIKTGSLRLSGSAAVFLAITWVINGNLVVQSEIQPNPATWLALSHQEGIPVSVTVDGVERVPVPESNVLDNHAWDAELQRDGLRLSSKTAETGNTATDNNEFTFGYVASSTLQSLHLFNTFDHGPFRFTGQLTAGTSGLSLRPYPFVLNVGRFEDELSSYEIVLDGTSVASGSLRNKTGDALHIGEQHFLLMVTAANHAPDGKDVKPWVRFGIVELRPQLETSVRGGLADALAQ